MIEITQRAGTGLPRNPVIDTNVISIGRHSHYDYSFSNASLLQHALLRVHCLGIGVKTLYKEHLWKSMFMYAIHKLPRKHTRLEEHVQARQVLQACCIQNSALSSAHYALARTKYR